MTPDEIDAAIGRGLLRILLRNLKLSEADWRNFKTVGIPLDWAEAIEAASEGGVKVSDWAHVIHPPRVLTNVKSPVNTSLMMTDATKLKLSRQATGTSDKRFNDTIRKAGYSQGKLAKAVGISPALLSRARAKGEQGRAIRESTAKKIEALTKWPADVAHWPSGFVTVKD